VSVGGGLPESVGAKQRWPQESEPVTTPLRLRSAPPETGGEPGGAGDRSSDAPAGRLSRAVSRWWFGPNRDHWLAANSC
jgi:hypothetical protein